MNELKVYYSKKELLEYFAYISVLVVAGIYMLFIDEFYKSGIFVLIFTFVISFFYVFSTISFYIKINGEDIKVRTKLGRRYQFNVSDIKKVICSKTFSPKTGISFYITIVVKSKELELHHSMVGFDKIAEYIYKKIEDGEIDKSVISKSSQKELIRYKNREIYPTKKQKTKDTILLVVLDLIIFCSFAYCFLKVHSYIFFS